MFCSLNRCNAVRRLLLLILTSLPFATLAETQGAETLSLDYSLAIIKQNDFRLKQLQIESDAHVTESMAAQYLPDPVVFAAMQNLPTDTFKLDQEPMTQLRMGVRQMFPKGESLDIKADLASLKSGIQTIKQQAHWLSQKKAGEQSWLEAWYWQRNLALLEEDRGFLTQVLDFIRSLYEVGAKAQSDLIGAELELIKLDEKRIEAKRKFQTYRHNLDTLANEHLKGSKLAPSLPSLASIGINYESLDSLAKHFANHPMTAMLNEKVRLAEKNVELIDQDFEPAWGLEMSYGLRDGENMDGSDRTDLLSAGVSVQLPIFSKGKQHHNKSAATQRVSAAAFERDEALHGLRFQYQNIQQQHQATQEQRVLYETDILPTLAKQKETALRSYESDKGDLRMVMAIFLKEQSAKTMHQRLRVDEQKLISSLNFLIGLDNGANKK